MTLHFADEWLTVHAGDVRAVLPEIEPDSIDCVVTSPPFWGLRDYGMLDQIGLEPTPDAYVAALVQVFREVRRVLRPTGTVWLNLGDSYAASRSGPVGRYSTLDGGGPSHGRHYREAQAASRWSGRSRTRERFPDLGIKPKDLVGIPWRVAFALQADGWYLRADIIWSKPNPMPESVTDRPTKSHEYLFLLAKSERYYYDAAAIREGLSPDTHASGNRGRQARPGPAGDSRHQSGHIPWTPPNGPVHSPYGQGFTRRSEEHTPAGWDTGEGRHDGVPEGRYADGRWPRGWASGPGRGHNPRTGHYTPPSRRDGFARDGAVAELVLPGQTAAQHRSDRIDLTPQPGRNRRSVWTISTQPYPGAHFATFPPKLVEPCILAGCPEGGVVLDPFAGTGTVGLVAQQLSRRAVLVELNADYLTQCLERNRAIPMGLTEVPA